MTLKKIADVILPTRWADFNLWPLKAPMLDKCRKENAETALALTLGRHSQSPSTCSHSLSMHDGRGLPLHAV
jgi:hypothetical protein